MSSSVFAKPFKCGPQKKNDDKKTFCFFSLNNPEEFHTMGKKLTGINKKQQDIYKKDNIIVKEYYGTKHEGKDVEKRFKAMLQEGECDSLIISGHHIGYFAGDRSLKNKSENQTLNLDFMEDLSCEPSCADWFSNVDSLFLSGCQTIKTKNRFSKSETGDNYTLDIVMKEAEGGLLPGDYLKVNRAMSSALDEENPLSHRYLRMFPNSSIYGWGGISPGEKSGSKNSIPHFIEEIKDIQSHIGNPELYLQRSSEEKKDALKFVPIVNTIQFINSGGYEEKCMGARKWARHWEDKDNISVATACYFKDEKTQLAASEIQKKGCELTRALKSEDKDVIKNALGNVSSTPLATALEQIGITEGSKEGLLDEDKDIIRANLNHIMSLITSKEGKKKDWYPDVIGQLKTSGSLETVLEEEILGNKKISFARKADYLYLYKEIFDGQDKDASKKISHNFLNHLKTSSDENAFKKRQKKEVENPVAEFMNYAQIDAMIHVVKENKLTDWLYENDKETFLELTKSFSGENGSRKHWDKW